MDERKLEAYLNRLEKALFGIPVGDRAEILTEIRSHARDAQAENPERAMDDILSALGDPAAVAERYRTERGFGPAVVNTPARRSALRTVVFAMVAMFTVTMLAFTALAWRAWPLIRVNESGVTLLGGAIDVRADDFDFEVGDRNVRLVEGRIKTVQGTVDEASIAFNNGKVEMKTTDGDELHWRCKVRGEEATESQLTKTTQGVWKLDLTGSSGTKCELAVPLRVKTLVKGSNGKVELERPRGPVSVELNNGKISFTPDPSRHYRVDASVKNGSKDEFSGLEGPSAIPMKFALANGKIQRD